MPETNDLNSAEAVRQQLITRPLQWGIGLAALMFLARFLVPLLEGRYGIPLGTAEQIPSLAIIMVIPTFTLLYGVALRVLQLNTSVSDHISKTSSSSDSILNLVGDLKHSNVRLSKISEHIDEIKRFDDLVEIAKSSSEIRFLSSKNDRASGLIEWRQDELIADCKRNLARLASGELVFSDPEEEWALNAKLISFLQPSLIRAISRNDEHFWRSKVGKAFLDEQKIYLCENQDRKIMRIFVVQEKEDYEAILAAQISAGILVRQISEAEFLKFKIKESDFVIYENLCLRTSKIIGQGKDGLPELKDPDVSLDNKKIADFSGKFDRVWLASDAILNGADA
jgi:hypothetical protein